MSVWDRLPLPAGVLPPGEQHATSLTRLLPAIGWGVSGGTLSVLNEAARRSFHDFGLEALAPTVIVMVDGLGLNQVLDKLGHARTLRRMPTRPVAGQTCAPSTTASALTAFATGQLPGQTNMVGYSVSTETGVMNLIKFRAGVDARSWQPVATLFESFAEEGIRSAVVTDPRFANSGLTHAAMRGPQFIPASTLPDRFDAALAALRKGAVICYVYWAAVDKVGHSRGPASNQWAEALEDFDSALSGFLRRIPSGVQVILTADHGMIQTGKRVDIAQEETLGQGVKVLAGEGRAAHVHALEGQSQAVLKRWQDFWGEDAWVFPREDFAAVLGEGPGLSLVGDVLVMPKSSTVVVDSRTQSASSIAMKGVHGSLTADEMLVPVWRLA